MAVAGEKTFPKASVRAHQVSTKQGGRFRLDVQATRSLTSLARWIAIINQTM
jgi:hypothetical protein